MLLANEIIERIDEIVERSYIDFTFDLLGEEFLTDEQKIQVEALGLLIGRKPLIELLYVLVRQRSQERYQTDATLQSLLDQISQTGVLPVLNDAQQYTIDHTKHALNENIENVKHIIKKKVKREILNINNETKQEQTLTGVLPIPQAITTTESKLDKLFIAIGVAVVASHSEFVKGFTSELTDFINSTAVDATVTQVGIVNAKDALVYKTVVNDGSLCQWCSRFYLESDGKSVIYKISELQVNGTNDGKPKSQWRPVIGKTHPRCRCQLHSVPIS